MTKLKAKKEKTREKILGTALKLFSERGYLGTTTKEIATLAGITETTLFRHFPSKEVIFEEVLKRYSFLQKLKELLPQVEDLSADKAFTLLGKAFLERLRERKPLITILHSELNLYPKQVRNAFQSIVSAIKSEFSWYPFTLKERGEPREDVHPEIAGQALLGMIFSYFLLKDIKGVPVCENFSEEDILKEYIQIFLKGVKK
jgi:AcrR family transcriptional regulator